MTAKRMNITLPEWLYKDLEIGTVGNKSARVQELLIKGYLSEQQSKLLDPSYAEGLRKVLGKESGQDWISPDNVMPVPEAAT